MGEGRVSSGDWCLFLEPITPGVLGVPLCWVGEAWSGLFKRLCSGSEQLGKAAGTEAEERSQWKAMETRLSRRDRAGSPGGG